MTPQALTHAELDELAALEAKATPGEWLQEPWYCEEGGWCAMGPHRECDPDSDDELEETDEPGSPCHKRAQADAAYVRALTAAAPALLAMARRLGEVTCQKCKRAFPHNEEMVCMCCNASLVSDACFYENRYVHVGDLTQQLTAATARAEALQARAQAAENRELVRENEVLRSNSDHLSSENASLARQVESMAMRIESLAEELAKPEDARLREVLDALDGRAVIFDGLGARVGHLLDEMDEWIGRAGEAGRMVEAARRILSSVAESMTEHAYQELASALESPPRIAGKTAGFDQPGREHTAGDALGLRRDR